MIARITRWLLLVQLVFAAGVAYCVFAITTSIVIAVATGIACIIVVRLLICANNFHISWRHGSPTPVAYQLSLAQKFRLFFGEFNASINVSSWRMPFFQIASYQAQHSDSPPILLVHGYGCNGAYWWSLSRILKQAKLTHTAIDMEPPLADIDDYVESIDRAVNLLHAANGKRHIIIVAHSMGGLAVRAYLRRHGSARIAKVITLGTPHHGTYLANFAPGINSRQMSISRQGAETIPSAWLQQLADDENDASRALFVSIYSHHDNIIAPQISAQLSGAKNIEFGGIGHVALAFEPQIQTAVLDEIWQTSRQAV